MVQKLVSRILNAKKIPLLCPTACRCQVPQPISPKVVGVRGNEAVRLSALGNRFVVAEDQSNNVEDATDEKIQANLMRLSRSFSNAERTKLTRSTANQALG